MLIRFILYANASIRTHIRELDEPVYLLIYIYHLISLSLIAFTDSFEMSDNVAKHVPISTLCMIDLLRYSVHLVSSVLLEPIAYVILYIPYMT